MSNAIIPPTSRRSRGRPKKGPTVSTGINRFILPRATLSQKRRIEETVPDDIEIINLNGFEDGGHGKKSKLDDGQPTRSQPPRRARFTESYDAAADVVVLSDDQGDDDDSESESDSDCGPIPSPVLRVRSREEQDVWDGRIERLKKDLCDEEMKLLLLRKLKESQKSKDLKRESTGSPAPTAAKVVQPQVQKPPPTVTLKGGVQIQPLPNKQLLSNNKHIPPKKDIKPEIPAHPSSLSVQPSMTFKPIQPSFKTVKAEPSPSIPAAPYNSVEKLSSNHLHQFPLLKNLSNQITITPVPPPVPSSSAASVKQEEKIDMESLQQRQAAAKLALRKQLEKTLLQIPLPKPPPLKMNFFPNPNSAEFLCLLGLDCAVDFLTRSSKKTTTPPRREPMACAQCSTDFTCAWKWKEVERRGKKAYDVFCEACINSNIRKSLKAQHTNNLKSAFLKALQQEKEIDKLSQNMPKQSSQPSPAPREQPPPLQQQQHQRLTSSSRVPAPAHQANTPPAFSIPKVGLPLPYIPKSSPALNHAALAQLSKLPQYQSLLQVQAQQLLASGMPLHHGGMLSFAPYMTPPLMNHSHAKSSASQGHSRRHHYRNNNERVQSPSIPQSSSSWKA